MEAILKQACEDHCLSAIGVNIFDPLKPEITVYLHFQDGDCTSATAATFEDAVASAALEAEERRRAA
jgi:hypothetical protein